VDYCKQNGVAKPKDPYFQQACEDHAWTGGRNTGQAAYALLKKAK